MKFKQLLQLMETLELPYLEKDSTYGDIIVFIVDGNYVRTNVDEEFTNFGHHFRYLFIPENEFWIDVETPKEERKYFIDHLLVEYKLMKEGKSYNEALEYADKVEKRERKRKSKLTAKKRLHIDMSIYKSEYRVLSDKLTVWLVDGKLVRDLYDVDFVEGGHDLVYSSKFHSKVFKMD